MLVQIDAKGDVPEIEPIKTGQLTWVSREFEMKDYSSLIEIKDYFDSINEIDMVRLILHGELPLEHKEELDNILEFQTTKHRNFRVNLESLDFILPPELESPVDFGDPTLNQTEIHLKQLLSNETDQIKRRIIIEAISHLQKFGKDIEI